MTGPPAAAKTLINVDDAGVALQGHDAVAYVADGKTQPDQFKIQDGTLLLFTNAEFHVLFDKDPAGNLAAADKNWPGLVEKHGR